MNYTILHELGLSSSGICFILNSIFNSIYSINSINSTNSTNSTDSINSIYTSNSSNSSNSIYSVELELDHNAILFHII